MAITTMDSLVAALASSQNQKIFIPSVTTVSGGWVHLNQAAVTSFGQLAAPTAFGSGGTTYDQSSFAAGAGFPKWTGASGGNTTYIGRMSMTPAGAGTVHVYDIAWACTGFSGTSTSAQSVSSFSGLPSRYTGGANLEIWVFCTTATGASASNLTVQYTNQAGTSGRNTVSTAHITSMPANRMYQVPLQSGDTGVQSIQSVTLSASTGTAGSFGVMIVRRVTTVPCAIANVATVMDFAALGMPVVSDDMCALFIHQGTTTTTGIEMGLMSIIQG